MKRSIHYKNILKTAVTAALCAVIILGTAACGNGSAKAEPSPSSSVEPTATPVPVEKVKVATINDIDDSLNVRSEASTDSEILGTAEAGEVFEVVAQDDTSEWVEISYFGQNAYVFAEFVTISEKEKTALATATPSPTPNAEDGTTDDNGDSGDAQNGGEASPTPAPTAEPTPNANNPIIVNGGNRENTSSGSTSDGMTAETIRDTEDPERR